MRWQEITHLHHGLNALVRFRHDDVVVVEERGMIRCWAPPDHPVLVPPAGDPLTFQPDAVVVLSDPEPGEDYDMARRNEARGVRS